jgi:hypothetical protein
MLWMKLEILDCSEHEEEGWHRLLLKPATPVTSHNEWAWQSFWVDMPPASLDLDYKSGLSVYLVGHMKKASWFRHAKEVTYCLNSQQCTVETLDKRSDTGGECWVPYMDTDLDIELKWQSQNDWICPGDRHTHRTIQFVPVTHSIVLWLINNSLRVTELLSLWLWRTESLCMCVCVTNSIFPWLSLEYYGKCPYVSLSSCVFVIAQIKPGRGGISTL